MEDSCSSASRKRSPPACKGDKDESPKKKKVNYTFSHKLLCIWSLYPSPAQGDQQKEKTRI